MRKKKSNSETDKTTNTVTKETKSLGEEQIKNLNDVINNKPNFSKQGSLGEFFDLYLICEVTARKLIKYNTGKVTLKLNITSIKSAVNKFFPNILNEELINNIFKSAKSNRNKNTCRKLRNKYLHSLSKEGRKEIEERIEELKGYMNKWIALFEDLKL